MTRSAVFLDRDGVLVETRVQGGKPYAVRSLDAFRLVAGAAREMARLKAAGFLLVVVTNQPDVGNGEVARDVVEAMHRKMRDDLPIDAIEACYHGQDAGCGCRKPEAGMLYDASRVLDIDLSASYMIGDRWSDIVAGRKAGCYTVFIDFGYREPCQVEAHRAVRTLNEAVTAVLDRAHQRIARLDEAL